MLRALTVLAMISVLFLNAEAQRVSLNSISGRVVSEKGEPVANAHVEFWLVTGYGRFIRATATTCRDGGYLINGLPRAKGMGMVSHPEIDRGPVEQPVEVNSGANHYKFVL